jgi:glycerophosphoryl diester phosphodiesterase
MKFIKMNRIVIVFGCLFLLAASCTTQKKEKEMRKLDVQGHRGARGLLPENTIPAFLLALDYGVTTLELDLAVSKDGQLVVSHEPWMNFAICTDSLGNDISEADQMSFNLHQMGYAEIAKFDCGSKGNHRFPEQKPQPAVKPQLTEVFAAVNQHLKENPNISAPNYNIEIKSMQDGDSIFHPLPAQFSDLVYTTIVSSIGFDKVNIQSFDMRILQYFHEQYPNVVLALLIENEHSVDKNIEDLGFTPQIYSCYYQFLTESVVHNTHNLGMKVIPWTVNELTDMQQLVDWGVDGIITDYPDRAAKLNK